MKIRHIPGATNTAADALSRICCPLITFTDADSWLPDYKEDPQFASIFGLSGSLLTADRLHRGRFWKGDLIEVPRRRVQEVLTNFHDGATTGYLGVAKTMDLLSRIFTIPHLRKMVNDFVGSWPTCQVSKAEHASQRGLLQSTVLPCVDCIPFPWIGRLFPNFAGSIAS